MRSNGTLRLESGATSAVIHPDDGGRLGQLDLGQGPLLREWAQGLGWAAWGSYPLVPWSNRIPRGRLKLGRIDAHLPVNWPDGSAIHGLVASCPWSVRERSDDSVHLDVEVRGGPYHVRGEQSYEVRPNELRQRLAVVNLGDDAVPVGLGIHPWFRAGPVRVPADRKWPGDPVPTGPHVPVDDEDDLRSPRVPALMDRCFTSLTGASVDVPGVRLHWSGPVTQVVVYTGEPGWVCVEPVTMANDGFGLAERGTEGHGVVFIDPGGPLEVTYRFERRG